MILLDVVLGHGAHPDPAGELAPAIAAVGDDVAVVVSLVGAKADPQDLTEQAEALQSAGAHVFTSNAQAARFACDLIATGLVDSLAHLDLIKIHGHRPAADIGTLVNETLEFIHARNLAIELSTAGWRKPVNELYPSDSIIELAMEKGIPFTTASDAHSHVQLGENFANLANKMAEIGIRRVCIFEKHKRAEVPL